MWIRLHQLLRGIIASTEIEATHNSIAYHTSERGGELHFSQSSSLRRFY